MAASTRRWDGPVIVSARSSSHAHAHTHTHIYNESDEKCRPVCCNCCVLGGADQEVNMIQSSSFISLMTALATNGDRRRSARLKVATYCRPAGRKKKPHRSRLNRIEGPFILLNLYEVEPSSLQDSELWKKGPDFGSLGEENFTFPARPFQDRINHRHRHSRVEVDDLISVQFTIMTGSNECEGRREKESVSFARAD